MWKKIYRWLGDRSQYTSIGLFFSWGVIMSVFSGGMGTIWSIPILLLTHVINGAGMYFGILRDQSGKRSTLGIALNAIGMIYNLSIDMFFVLL